MKVSLIFLCYNQRNYVRDALLSCLKQDYKDAEVLIGDDCSTDGTAAVVQETVASFLSENPSAKVITIFRKKNIGVLQNFSDLCHRASGEYCVTFAGDDLSSLSRVSRLIDFYYKNDQPSAMCSSFSVIGAGGELIKRNLFNFPSNRPDFKFQIGREFSLCGASSAFSLNLITSFDAPDPLVYEDILLTYRALLENGVAVCPDDLVSYRSHDTNLSSVPNKSVKVWRTRRARLLQSDVGACRTLLRDIESREASRFKGVKNCIEGVLLDNLILISIFELKLFRALGLSLKTSKLKFFIRSIFQFLRDCLYILRNSKTLA